MTLLAEDGALTGSQPAIDVTIERQCDSRQMIAERPLEENEVTAPGGCAQMRCCILHRRKGPQPTAGDDGEVLLEPLGPLADQYDLICRLERQGSRPTINRT